MRCERLQSLGTARRFGLHRLLHRCRIRARLIGFGSRCAPCHGGGDRLEVNRFSAAIKTNICLRLSVGVTEVPFDPLADSSNPSSPFRSSPNLLLGLRRGVFRTCPACGQGNLFCGYLAVEPSCKVCGNDNEQYPSDDFAPYVTIFLVLHLMVPILFTADRTWDMSVWFEGAIAIPIFLVAMLVLLPFVKGGVIGFAWAMGVTRSQSADR